MKKRVKNALTVLGIAVVVVVIMSMGMGLNKKKLAECFTEEEVIRQAQEDIILAESDDYEGWKARFSPELQEKLTEDSYIQYLGILKEKGAFTEFGKTALTGQEKDGINYAIAVVVAGHENGDIKYTIMYDEKMNLISFVM